MTVPARRMTLEHQQLFTNVLRDCLGLEPLYSDNEQDLHPTRYSKQRRAAAKQETNESETNDSTK